MDNEIIPKASVGNSATIEGDPLEFTVSLDIPAAMTTYIEVYTEDGTAIDTAAPTGPQDYVAHTSCVVFPANSTEQTVTVTTLNDDLVEPTEHMYLHLVDPTTPAYVPVHAASSPCNFSPGDNAEVLDIGTRPGIGTIYDNDYQVWVSDETEEEGDEWYDNPNQMSFSVTVSPAVRPGDVVFVDYVLRPLAGAEHPAADSRRL